MFFVTEQLFSMYQFAAIEVAVLGSSHWASLLSTENLTSFEYAADLQVLSFAALHLKVRTVEIVSLMTTCNVTTENPLGYRICILRDTLHLHQLSKNSISSYQ